MEGNVSKATDGATALSPERTGEVKDQGKEPAGLCGVIVTRLAELPDRALLDERALAHVFGVTKRTVRRMVGRYELPPPVRLAGRATWQAGQVLRWFEGRAERLAREANRRSRRLEETSRSIMEHPTKLRTKE